MTPVIVIVFDVNTVLSATPLCAAKPNASGVVSPNCALQEAGVPPLIPAQDHVHGATVDTAEATPTEQRSAVGAVANAAPFAAPQTPFIGDGIAPTTAFVTVTGLSYDRT